MYGLFVSYCGVMGMLLMGGMRRLNASFMTFCPSENVYSLQESQINLLIVMLQIAVRYLPDSFP